MYVQGQIVNVILVITLLIAEFGVLMCMFAGALCI